MIQLPPCSPYSPRTTPLGPLTHLVRPPIVPIVPSPTPDDPPWSPHPLLTTPLGPLTHPGQLLKSDLVWTDHVWSCSGCINALICHGAGCGLNKSWLFSCPDQHLIIFIYSLVLFPWCPWKCRNECIQTYRTFHMLHATCYMLHVTYMSQVLGCTSYVIYCMLEMHCILFWVHPNVSHMSTCHLLRK